MDRKKQETVSSVWRKVSTLSSRQQEYVVKDVKIDSGNLLAVSEVEVGDDQNLSPGSLQNQGIIGGSEEEQIASAEKHPISIYAISSTQKHSIAAELWNKEPVEAAAQSVSSKVMDLDSQPVSIGLKGLECMRGSFAKARVLYAPVEEIGTEGQLLRACQVIIDAFVEAGLVLEKVAQQKLKEKENKEG